MTHPELDSTPENIVEGLCVDVPHGEVKKLLVERAKYHEQRAQLFSMQLDELASREKTVTDRMTHEHQRIRAEHERAVHVASGEFHKFAAEHVIAGAVYRLSPQDLDVLGVGVLEDDRARIGGSGPRGGGNSGSLSE